MKQDLVIAIEQEYGISIQTITPGPRQFVASTFILDGAKGEQYFCKVIDKPLFIQSIIDTLPVVEEMSQKGVERICYPIRGLNGLHLFVDNTLIVLFNYISAPQGLDYSVYELGRLIATIHAITPQIMTEAPKETFEIPNGEMCMEPFERTMRSTMADLVIQQLKSLLKEHEKDIRNYLNEFIDIAERCIQSHFELVITHGDIATNILVKSPTDLTIIDWDELRLAPAERDIWMKDEHAGFLEGYRSMVPHFQVNKLARRFFILQYFFERMNYFIAEIIDITKTADQRHHLLERLAQGRMAGRNQFKLEGRT